MPAHTHCRICGGALPEPFFDLGPMPLANAFLSSPGEFVNEAKYPLATTACPKCRLVQLNYVVPAEQLYRDYIYVSSTSDGVRAHAEHLAETLTADYGWSSRDLVVEVASNDGTVLKPFKARGVRVLGVEPARNIAEIANAAGIPTVDEFFTEGVGRDLAAKHGRASAVMGRHVFAHVDDVHDFLRGVDHLLAPDGVLVIEVPYLGELIEKLEFDTIYHEHLSYFAVEPIVKLCEMHDLVLADVQIADLHGGSMILHIRRKAGGATEGPRVQQMRESENRRALGSPSTLAGFAADVAAWKNRLETLVDEVVRPGGGIVGYGAAAKANTLLNYCPRVAKALTVVLDRSPHKHNRYTPGTHLRVAPPDPAEWEGATHMLILAWNFQEEIRRQMAPFACAGGKFVVPIPEPRVL